MDADRLRADADAAGVERAERELEAAAEPADDHIVGDEAVVEQHAARGQLIDGILPCAIGTPSNMRRDQQIVAAIVQ